MCERDPGCFHPTSATLWISDPGIKGALENPGFSSGRQSVWLCRPLVSTCCECITSGVGVLRSPALLIFCVFLRFDAAPAALSRIRINAILILSKAA